MSETSMVERIARAMAEVNDHHQEFAIGDFRDAYMDDARAAIEAIPDDDEAFLAALAERVHDTCPLRQWTRWRGVSDRRQ